MIELEAEKREQGAPVVSIKVIGVGGAGGNTVNSIIESGNENVQCIVANTDAQALSLSKAEQKLQLGVKSTKGLGTGSNPDLGQRAAEEDLDKVMEVVGDADIVFLAAGMGGGTGSGGAPVIARALKERDILTIAIVTRPFLFEGKRRADLADQAIERLEKEVDTLIVLPNQKLLEEVDQDVSMIDAFSMINNILGQSVKGISDIISRPGHINVDFSDVRAIMKDMGLAIMGTGVATGPDRAQEAALQAVSSPLLENMNITGAHGVLLNITGGKNLGLHEISKAASIIYEEADENANIILGSVIDESLDQEVMITIIATGFKEASQEIVAEKEVSVGAVVAKEEPVLEAAPKDPSSSFAEATEDRSPTASSDQDGEPEKVESEETPAQEEKKEVTLQEFVESEVASEKENGEQSIDFDNLDVPAFLRKEAQAKDKSNVE